MCPESTPGSSARNGGSPAERATSRNRSVRRSEIDARSATAIARKSSTYPSGAPWKLPLLSTRPSGSTTGLSMAAASSRAATASACASVSRTAPCTCGEQRSEYASCTRVHSGLRWLSMIAEPSRRARRLAALRSWPGCGRRACRSAANTASVPSSPSTLIAAAMSAVRTSCSRSCAASTSMPSMPSVPLISARPSFSASATGTIPAAARASAAGHRTPSASRTVPSPVAASAHAASGARSPEQPSEPNSGTTGVMPAESMAA